MRIPWRSPVGGGPHRRWAWAGVALAEAILALGAAAWSSLSRDLDRCLADFALRMPRTVTKVLDRHGEVIGVFAEENRELIPYGDLPRAFVGAVIATEDARFLHHRGVCLRGAARAGCGFVASLGRRREGASTLTMQLVRTVTARRQRRLDRKLKEVILALKVEKAFTKMLRRMAAQHYLPGREAEALMARPIRLARDNAREAPLAPHAVEEVRKHLYETYGRERVLEGGLEVTTTIDAAWQAAANAAVANGLRAVDRRRGLRPGRVAVVADPDSAQLPGWHRHLRPGDTVRGIILAWTGAGAVVRIGAERLAVPGDGFAWAGRNVRTLLPRGAAPRFLVRAAGEDGRPTRLELDPEPEAEAALLAVEPATGEIRAMVGGADFQRSQFNRACRALRQPGSTLKPLVYAAAFAQGLTPAHPVADVPTRFLHGGSVYQPRNYERDYRGPMTIWEAVRTSRNLPVVRLLETTGIDQVLDLARGLGIDGQLQPYPSLALGAGETTLQAMVRGYATLATGGRRAPAPFLIKRVRDRDGRVLEDHAGEPGEPALDPMSAFQLVQCLQGAAERGTAALCAGLGWPLAGTPREPFPVPEGMAWAEVDRFTGLLAGPATPAGDRVRLAFKPGTAPTACSTPEAAAEARRAQEQAGGLVPETRIWGAAAAPGPGS